MLTGITFFHLLVKSKYILNYFSPIIGWPRLNWCVTENLSKPSRDWRPPPKQNADVPAYIEVKICGVIDLLIVDSSQWLLMKSDSETKEE